MKQKSETYKIAAAYIGLCLFVDLLIWSTSLLGIGGWILDFRSWRLDFSFWRLDFRARWICLFEDLFIWSTLLLHVTPNPFVQASAKERMWESANYPLTEVRGY